MSYYLFKIGLTIVLVAAISEIAKRSTFTGALLASLPIVSILTIFWLYIETKNIETVSTFAISIFWLVLPSLLFFLTLSWFLKQGLNFYTGLALAAGITVLSYGLLVILLKYYGFKL